MSKPEDVYNDIRSGHPKAVEFYQNLKARAADGEQARKALAAIRGVHERKKAASNPKPRVGVSVGADYPEGSYLTPNGKVLTPDVLAQVVDLINSYAGMVMTTASSTPKLITVSPVMMAYAKAKAASTATPIILMKKPAATKTVFTPFGNITVKK